MANDALVVIQKELDTARARMAMLVPKSIAKTYDVTKQVATFAIEASRNPALLDCSPMSIKLAFYHAASLGLEIGSSLGHAYLVPYGGTCQMIPGFKGLIYAAVRSGACRQIWAQTVHEHDTFAWREGTDPKLDHLPNLGERGDVIACYAVARLHGGGTQFVVLPLSEIQKVRASSKTGRKGPWADWFEEMAKKSAIRRLTKQLAISTDEQRATFLKAVTIDAEIDGGATPEQVSATLGIQVDATAIEAPKPSSAAPVDAALEAVVVPEGASAGSAAPAETQAAPQVAPQQAASAPNSEATHGTKKRRDLVAEINLLLKAGHKAAVDAAIANVGKGKTVAKMTDDELERVVLEASGSDAPA